VKLDKFGDSYGIVKQGLLRWLSPCGPWLAHPMFTGPGSRPQRSLHLLDHRRLLSA